MFLFYVCKKGDAKYYKVEDEILKKRRQVAAKNE